jgi:ClpP class serine protease
MIEAGSNKNIAGIVMDGNSGGGSVNSISPIQYAAQKIKAMGKPIVGLVDMSASAHYYMNTFFDHIMASNNISAEIGSIGVMASWQDVQPYYEVIQQSTSLDRMNWYIPNFHYTLESYQHNLVSTPILLHILHRI